MSFLLCQGDAGRIPLPDRSVDLVFGSPPYVDCRSYFEGGRDLGIARDCASWVEWMLRVTTEALRVSRGAALWVAAGKTEDRSYWPACEGLMWEWWRRGLGTMYRPCYWKRSGIPGSGGDQWFRADVEYVMCFKRRGPLPWAENTALGGGPKYAPGGSPSYRSRDGSRLTGRGKWKGSRRRSGNMRNDEPCGVPNNSFEILPEIANPGNLIDTGAAGGGQIGSWHAHESEAPFPEALAEFFVASLCPPKVCATCGTACPFEVCVGCGADLSRPGATRRGLVLDPFSGSGTTAAVAERLGRVGVGMDLRRSQAVIARRRIERPHSRPVKLPRPDETHPLFEGRDCP